MALPAVSPTRLAYRSVQKEIIPGDTLIIEAYVDSWKRGICKGHATGYTDGEVACEAKMMITIPEILEQYLPKRP